MSRKRLSELRAIVESQQQRILDLEELLEADRMLIENDSNLLAQISELRNALQLLYDYHDCRYVKPERYTDALKKAEDALTD